MADVSEALGIRATAVVRFPLKCVPSRSGVCVLRQPRPEFGVNHDGDARELSECHTVSLWFDG